MNLDLLFEDLETQFDAAIDQAKTRPTRVVESVKTSVSGNRLSLERPVFGIDFTAGLVSGKAVWRFQPYRSLSTIKLTFGIEPANQSEPQTATDFLTQSVIGRFCRYSMFGDGQQIRKGRVLSVLNGLLLFEATNEVIAIAVERLAWLEVHAGDN